MKTTRRKIYAQQNEDIAVASRNRFIWRISSRPYESLVQNRLQFHW